jgi:hypothetical protein
MCTTRKSLNDQLQQFYGSEQITRHALGLVYLTDGIVFMKEKFALNWLVDTVAFHSTKFKDQPFLCWKLSRIEESGSFNLICTDDNENLLYKERIDFSDCESDTVDIWFCHPVMMLPSEY